MRSLPFLVFLVACGNSPDPRLIAGGGISDGEIDGRLNIYVIDGSSYDPIANATVHVGSKEAKTDAKGLVVFEDLSGKQTVAVKADGFRSAAWIGANGANMTVPLTKLTATPDQAQLSGTIAGWDQITVPSGHIKVALVTYSQNDKLADADNNIATPNNTNVCGFAGTGCNFTVASRTGTVTLVAAIFDRDLKGTPADPNDDTMTITGWATKSGLTVEKGVDQTGLSLAQVEAGNLQTVTIDYGAPPAALPQTNALIGIEVGGDEVVQLPAFAQTDKGSVLAPKPSVFGATSYRLTAIAQTTSGDTGAQSIILRHDLAGTSLAAGTWLVPPTGVTVTRTSATFDKVDGAKLYSVQYSDSTGIILELTSFDGSLSLDVPATLTLPSGTLTAKAQAIGANIDLTDFSLDVDKHALWGISAQPAASVP